MVMRFKKRQKKEFFFCFMTQKNDSIIHKYLFGQFDNSGQKKGRKQKVYLPLRAEIH